MKSKTAEYMCWANMKQRCYNERNDRFPDYGGRGRGRHKTSKGDKRGRPAKTFTDAEWAKGKAAWDSRKLKTWADVQANLPERMTTKDLWQKFGPRNTEET